ncbi:right-handed parallel beta-helix repeat-containing protein [Streptomyces sp. NPDC008125]|uniref:right-handed parallel beta-helix repeat-containing protein n=1 Tax=Streptomyces sp. NPDC008125 TaxID=3364811 RepID=UPI0036E82A30
MRYTYGGSPSEVLTTTTGDVVPDWPVTVRVAGTGQPVTALYEISGDPIGQLRSNPAGSPAPGAIREWQCEWPQISYEYLAGGGQTVAWTVAGREVATSALQVAQAAAAEVDSKLDKAGGTVTGPVVFESPISAPNLGDLSAGRIFTVREAAADGITDDAPAIQAVLDAAYAAGGGIVLIPGGRTYGVGTFLVIRARTTVWAYGATIRTINPTRGCVRNFAPDDVFNGYEGHSNITVLGGTWDGNAYKAADGTGIGTGTTNIMTFIHCANVIVKDAVFRDTTGAHALEINAVSGCRVEACRFEGFVDNTADQSRVTSEFVEIDIARSGNSAIGAWDGTACRDVTFERCYFGPSARLPAAGRAIGSHGITAGSWYDRITVRDCEIYGTTADCGIRAYYWRDSHLSGNTISGTATAGILAVTDASTSQATRALTITDNIISGSLSDAGIRVAAVTGARWSDVQIRGNTILGATGYGIRADYAPAVLIADNRVSATTSGGILVQDCDTPTVDNNTVTGAGSNAINLAGCANGSVTGNVVDTTASNHGIVAGTATLPAKNINITGNIVRAAAVAGIRLGAPGCLISGNQIRKDGGATATGVSMVAAATGCVVVGNDLSGNGWTTAAAIVTTTAAPITSATGGTTLPGSNAINSLGPAILATAATATAETVVATMTIPAGDAVAGTGYQFLVQGTASTTATPTLTIRVRLGGVGGVVLAAFGAVTTGSAIASRGWRVEGTAHCVTAGASATWAAAAILRHHLAATTGAQLQELTDAAVTRDSTTDQALVVTAQWSAASASNTATATVAQLSRVA